MKLDIAAITNDNATALVDRGLAAIRGGDLAIDLAGVAKVDSAAVALLLAWQRAAHAQGGCLALANVPPALASLATLYGIDALLGCPQRHRPA